jgi:hypothetical protein
MNMIGHQYKGMNHNAILERTFFQVRQIGFVVRLITKAGFAVIAALNDMMGNTRE